MINVDLYIEQLDALKHYIFAKLDNRLGVIVIDYEALPKFSAQDVLKLWFETGVIISSSPDDVEVLSPVYGQITFEEYLDNSMDER